MQYRTFPGTDISRQRSRLRHVDHLHRLVGREDRRRSGGDAASRARRPWRHLLRRGRRVRKRTRRAADRRGVPRSAQRDRDRHEGRLRHLRRSGAEARRGQQELPMRTDPGVHALRRRQVPRASRDRLHRRPPDPQREDGARPRRRAVGDAARAAARGEDPRVGRGVRSGHRLAVRSRRARGARAGHQHDPDDLERARAASGHGDDRGRASSCAQLLLQRARHARQRDARGEVHRGHGVPGERSSPAPAAQSGS